MTSTNVPIWRYERVVNPSRYLEVLHSSNGRERVAPVTMQEFVRIESGILRGRIESVSLRRKARSPISSVWR